MPAGSSKLNWLGRRERAASRTDIDGRGPTRERERAGVGARSDDTVHVSRFLLARGRLEAGGNAKASGKSIAGKPYLIRRCNDGEVVATGHIHLLLCPTTVSIWNSVLKCVQSSVTQISRRSAACGPLTHTDGL